MNNEKNVNEEKIEDVSGGCYLSVNEFEALDSEEKKKLINSAKLSDDVLTCINGGTLEETQELLDWCNRHGAGITRTADHPDIDASILWFLATKYPELGSYSAYIYSDSHPNYVMGMPHKDFMALLRKKYGD